MIDARSAAPCRDVEQELMRAGARGVALRLLEGRLCVAHPAASQERASERERALSGVEPHGAARETPDGLSKMSNAWRMATRCKLRARDLDAATKRDQLSGRRPGRREARRIARLYDCRDGVR